MRTEIENSDSTRRALIAVGASGLVMALLLLPVLGIAGALGIAAGALVALVNLYVLARAVQAFLGAGEPGAWAVAAVVKLAALLGILYFLLSSRLVEGLPLLIGLGALPIGVVVCQLTATRQTVPPGRRL
ncbi:MAG: hypothetical protein RJA70_1762 [Pseudomonadota bacterium]|jgi:hypothetical protein